jgi:SAM-dependent methyltransferase
MIESNLKCRICYSGRLSEKPFGYAFKGRWLGGIQCHECGIIFLHPQPTVEEITQMYSKEYFEGDFRCGHAGSYFDEATLDSLADSTLIKHIRQYKPSGTFLEVGCAGGAFLNAARLAGYSVKGVEYSDEAASFARAKFGLDVATGDLVSVKYPSASFDVVFMGDVLEHLPDPVATVMAIHRVLKAGGLLVIECPMQTNTLFSRFGFLLYSFLGKRATVHLPPYHLFEYRPASMKRLLESHGFEVTLLKEVLIHPKEVTLRGPVLQRVGKQLFQYPNYWLTSIAGILGDRIEVFATKKE